MISSVCGIYKTNEITKYPEILSNDKLEIAYVGMLHNNPKGIGIYYLDLKDCCFSVPTQ